MFWDAHRHADIEERNIKLPTTICGQKHNKQSTVDTIQKIKSILLGLVMIKQFLIVNFLKIND